MTDYYDDHSAPDDPDDGDDGAEDDGSWQDADWDDGVDPVLRHYVDAADEMLSEGLNSISLTVGGALITGTLIAHHVWEIREVDQVAGHHPEIADRWRRNRAEDEALGRVSNLLDGTTHPSRFIHLRDVRIFNGQQVIGVPLWRGRLDTVDGWCWGTVASPQ